MPFSGYPLPADKTNPTPQVEDHPTHHNDLALAVNELSEQLDQVEDQLVQVEMVVRLTRITTAPTINAGGDPTSISWNNEVLDLEGWHDNAVNPTRLTCPSGLDGLYGVRALAAWSTVAAVTRGIMHLKHNSTNSYHRSFSRDFTGGSTGSNASNELQLIPIDLVAGQFITIDMWHDSGTARNLQLVTAATVHLPISPFVELYRLSRTA